MKMSFKLRRFHLRILSFNTHNTSLQPSKSGASFVLFSTSAGRFCSRLNYAFRSAPGFLADEIPSIR